jgi:hypothetical protein
MRQQRQEEDPELRCVWENVASMPIEDRDRIAKILREIEPNMELVAIDARVSHWVNRPRLWWTNFFVAKRTDELDNLDKGVRTLVPWLHMALVETFLDPGAEVQWGGVARRFFTFLRPAPSETPHRAANGLATASVEAVSRWKADEHRYSPYQYETVNGVFVEGQWRPLNSRERDRDCMACRMAIWARQR